MKNLNLEAFDVQGMSTQEMKQTDGGTEIGYMIGYYITNGLRAVREAYNQSKMMAISSLAINK